MNEQIGGPIHNESTKNIEKKSYFNVKDYIKENKKIILKAEDITLSELGVKALKELKGKMWNKTGLKYGEKILCYFDKDGNVAEVDISNKSLSSISSIKNDDFMEENCKFIEECEKNGLEDYFQQENKFFKYNAELNEAVTKMIESKEKQKKDFDL